MNGNGITTLKGDTIGPWKLGSTLGVGSTGKVVMAYNETRGQQAAVKIISKSIFNAQGSTIIGGNDPDVLPYGIEREIIIMKLLNHPNVLRLYDVWETSKDLYMVLEYVEKGELFNLLVERGPLPENEAVRFFRQIIIGISYCHALGIVHRDLKPENLLLDHKFNVKLADFGMAALESKDKLLETSCGSPHYAAPEIVSGLPYHGFESDVWSCGVILYALLTGRLPFDEEDGNIRNLLLKVQSGKFEMPGDDEISPEAQDLIARILTVDPEQRIKTREILKHPLLRKYPSIKDSKSIRNLPREDTYLNPLSLEGGNQRVDETILQNLVVLWHGRNKEDIITKLMEPGANLEKTFYALLHRFKHDNYQDQLKQQELQKKQSISSNSLMYVGSLPSPNKSDSPVTTPKKKRTSIIVASSSHKRPVSMQKLNSQHSSPVKNGSIGKRLSKTFPSNKRISQLVSNSSSPTPAAHKRVSRINDSAAPPVPKEMLRDYKRQSKRQSKRFSLLPNMKRGSITTKLIATYAKLSEDSEWEYIEKETKRTSQDFATLMDQIFEHEKYEQIRKEKEELERKVNEARQKEEAERKERERIEREEQERLEREERKRAERQKELQDQMEDEIAKLKAEYEAVQGNSDERNTANGRSVSAPIEIDRTENKRDSTFGIKNDINELINTRNFSLQTRPVSRLDPGIIAAENRLSANLEDDQASKEKTILETIRRSKFLGSQFNLNAELEKAKKDSVAKERQEQLRKYSEQTAKYEVQKLPKNAKAVTTLRDDEVEPRKLSEVKVPQFTRRSKHFSSSNKRFSVLSLYSTKTSFTNLVDHLKNDNYLEPLPGQPEYSSSKVAQEPEFMFETVEELDENSKLYEVPETEEGNLASAARKEANGARKQTTNDKDINLPSLPPLQASHDVTDENGALGLGIYQPNDQTKKPHKTMLIDESIDENISSTSDASRTEGVKKPPLNDVVRKNNNERKPLEEITPKVENKRKISFFRKFSQGSEKKLGPESFDSQLKAGVSAPKMYKALDRLLNEWTNYGLKHVESSPNDFVISGKLTSDNILSLRSTGFKIAVLPGEGNGSIIQFTKKSGSTKTFNRLVKEIEKILEKEKVLVFSF
ncbi:Gin4/Kcc4 [Kluyveromyces lactis]|nr:Gin4/Kcc4 [Kluyveromyces lactis]